MLFDRILGNIATTDLDLSGKPDTATVEWHECNARALRKTTIAGATVGILVPIGASLRDGDILISSDDHQLTVRVPPTDVWVVQCRDAETLAKVALELGNLHVPVQVIDENLLTIPDGPTRQVLDRYRITYTAEQRVFAPLRATVLQGVKLADDFVIRKPS